MIWKNKKIWIILFSCAASASALAVFVILPLRERVYSKKDEMVKKQLMAEHLRKESTRAGEYKKDLAFLKENKEKIDEVFITEGEEIRLIQELENLAEAQGLSISINSLDKKNKKRKTARRVMKAFF